MKIAQIVCVFPPYRGGIGNSAYHFARLLAEKEHLVDVYSPLYKHNKTPKGKDKFNLYALKAPLSFGKGAFLPQIFFKLKKYDIVHLHYPFFGTVEIVWLAKIFFKSKFKLIIHYHMDTLGLSKIMFFLSLPARLIERNLFRRADAITYASIDYIKNSKIKSIYYENKDKFHEIPFGTYVDNEELQDKKNESCNEKVYSKIKNIIFVGGLDKAHYFKGLDVLFPALANINLKYTLNIVGSGNLMKYYKDLSQKHGIAKYINFQGSLNDEDLLKLYKKSDLLVLPSINNHEAFGIVLIEAMAQGVPVVTSNLPGVRSVFKDGLQGFLAKPGNIYSLRDKIEKIFQDNEKYKSMSWEAKNLVLEKYKWSTIGEKLDKLFKKINHENLFNQ